METHHGQSNAFGHADWYAAQAQGYNPKQIADWVRKNTHKLNVHGTNSAVYKDVMAAEGAWNAQQAQLKAQQAAIAADNAARQAAIRAQEQAQREAEAARQKQMEENEKARQQLLDEEKRAQEHEQALADERAATAEIAASNQGLGGGGKPENNGWGGFGASFREDPSEKFRKFDGTNFGSKNDSESKGTGWKESSLELTKQSRDPIESSIKTGTLIYSQRGTGKDKASTEEMNNSLFSDAKERAQKWTVGYGKRFG